MSAQWLARPPTPQNITMGNNGAIIPTTIADKIINQVKEICPIFAGVTMFHVKGTLKSLFTATRPAQIQRSTTSMWLSLMSFPS